ncbi:hypothetical protein QT972_25470 [Microcoleus sp. herbarium7]|uniref:hypothetical protein n=1 Tax=Microcoleus sp. herbarium7 TaxID=3055435 RepID=UPI002FD0BC87
MSSTRNELIATLESIVESEVKIQDYILEQDGYIPVDISLVDGLDDVELLILLTRSVPQ